MAPTDPSDPRRRSAGARVTLTVEEARAIQGLCVDVWGIMAAALARGIMQAAAPAVPAAQQRAAEEHANCSEGWQPQLDVAASAVPKLEHFRVLGTRTSPEAPAVPEKQECAAEEPAADFSGWRPQLALSVDEEPQAEEPQAEEPLGPWTADEEPQAEEPQAEELVAEERVKMEELVAEQLAASCEEFAAADEVPWQPGPDADKLFREFAAEPVLAARRARLESIGRAKLESMGYEQDEHGQWLPAVIGSSRRAVAAASSNFVPASAKAQAARVKMESGEPS